ncbi:MAG: hypothetical protein J0G33_14300 [Afipia felis]|nr:hypothetical protein [Afipia felis]
MLDDHETERMLGKAVLQCWGRLPHDVQEMIFEGAVDGGPNRARSDLALRLHEVHPRTEHNFASKRV